MAARTITLRVEGDKIAAQVFYQKVGAFLNMLHTIDRNVSEALDIPMEASVRWVIESIRSGSPVDFTLRAEAAADDVPESVGEQVIASATAGLRAFESTVPLRELPPYFTFHVVEEVQTLTRQAHDGVTGISVRTPAENVPLSLQTNTNVGRFLRPVFQHTGSVEGVLQMVSVAGGRPRLTIYDRLSGRAIRCTIPSERMPDVLRVFGQRVSVFGRVRTNELGDVLSIHMEDVQAFPLEQELPGIRDVAGVFDLTGGESIKEHLGHLRDAS